MPEPTSFQRELDRQLVIARRRIADDWRDIQLRDAIADCEAWGLILKHKGDITVKLASPYGLPDA